MGGGGTGGFSSIPLNIAGGKFKEHVVDYIVTGTWSGKAAKEAEKYCKVNRVAPKSEAHQSIPDSATWKTSKDASYLYYCDNETVHGVEFDGLPENPENALLACDMTSNFLTRPFDITKYGCVVAGAQKNFGVAALAVVVVREDLIKPMDVCPTVLDFKITADNNSLYNTPPCYP